MTRRSDLKAPTGQPTTRAERAKTRRRAQGRRNTAAWRRRKQVEAARAQAQAVREGAVEWTLPPDPPVTPAQEPEPPPEPEEPKPEAPYIRRAARVKRGLKPVPLAKAFDPRPGRRRVRIVIGEKTIEGEVDGSGSGGVGDLDWGNF